MPRSKKAPTSTQGSSKEEVVPLQDALAEAPASVTPAEGGGVLADAPAEGGSGRMRGPVEEVIAKRVRQLGKKIQRFRAYTAQVEKLNADQKSAIASLPILEAQAKELEDLIKPGGSVEVAELGEAAKMRGLKEEAEKRARSEVEGSSASFQKALTSPLSRFLHLHTLLHPARPADHTHLTFSPLDLPSQLQEEVQATDILRVGRMWEDLLAGGERAEGVLAGLVKGPTGDDEENDHVHHLLELLSQPTPQADPSGPVSVNGDTTDETIVAQTAPVSESGEKPEEPTEVVPPLTRENSNIAVVSAPQENGQATGNGGLNFLQESELDGPQEQGADEEFEVIESRPAHETEHYDIPEPTPAAQKAVPEPVQTSASFDWADEHDETELAPPLPVAPASGSAESTSAPAVEATAPTTEGNTAEAPTPSTVDPAGQPPLATGQQRGRGPRRGGPPSGPRRGGAGGGGRLNGGFNGTPGFPPPGSGSIPPKPTAASTPMRQGSGRGEKIVDEDGFEMKVKPSARGRGGGFGGGRGGGARGGGEFRGAGRGRGGAGRGFARTASTGPNGTQINGQGGGKPAAV